MNHKESPVVRLWSRRATNRPVLASKRPAERSWPLWAMIVAKLKSDADKGIGDTIERIIGKDNSETFKSWYKSTFGKSCGCSGRKAQWNFAYPYKH